MSELYLIEGTALDHKLTRLFFSSQTYMWYKFVKSLDENIIDVSRLTGSITRITFTSEAHKTWFLVRYS